MKYDLSDIISSINEVNGGICNFRIAPREWIDNDASIVFEKNIINTIPTLLPNKQWIIIESLIESIAFDEQSKDSDAGIFYQAKLQSIINGSNADLNSLLNTLPYYEYVVIFTDKNAVVKVLGNKNKGLTAKVDFTSSIKIADKPFYSVEFIGEFVHRAPVLVNI